MRKFTESVKSIKAEKEMLVNNIYLMKHSKKFESTDTPNDLTKDFGDIVYAFVDFVDDGFNLSFSYSGGNTKSMTYQQYLNKDNKYDIFMEMLAKELVFEVNLTYKKFDYKKMLSAAEEIQSSIDRLKDIKWNLEYFEIRGNTSLALDYRFGHNNYYTRRSEERPHPFFFIYPERL